jgi:C_GCAxxG_C_C family probable redox protein
VIAVGDHWMGQAPELLVRASCPFGGGVGGTREELCGVLSGGVLLLGAMRGRLSADQDDKPLYELVSEFRRRFVARFGSAQCQAVRDRMLEEDRRCHPVVMEGTRILLELAE